MALDLSQPVAGPYMLQMRPVTSQDAEFIYALRVDPDYNSYLSPISGGVEGQRSWINTYKTQEAIGAQYYFIIERKDEKRCGLVRLYNFQDDSFTWGSWILNHDKPPKAALESAFLIYDIAFEHLNADRALFEVMRDNEHTLAFHRRFGARQTGEDSENMYFEYTRKQFQTDRPNFIHALGDPK